MATRSKFLTRVGILAVVYWLAMFAATHVPYFSNPQSVPWLDKLEHFTAFGGLSIILCVAGASLWPVTWRLYAGVVGLVALYGVIDELTQFFVPGRQPDPRDWVANVTGSIVGVVVFAIVRSLRRKAAEKPAETARDK